MAAQHDAGGVAVRRCWGLHGALAWTVAVGAVVAAEEAAGAFPAAGLPPADEALTGEARQDLTLGRVGTGQVAVVTRADQLGGQPEVVAP